LGIPSRKERGKPRSSWSRQGSGEIAGAEELVRWLEEQVGDFNRALSRNMEGAHQATLSATEQHYELQASPMHHCSARQN
jgi:hypothetical protein